MNKKSNLKKKLLQKKRSNMFKKRLSDILKRTLLLLTLVVKQLMQSPLNKVNCKIFSVNI